MICDRCGRENLETLVFCQDCGQRLIVPSAPARAWSGWETNHPDTGARSASVTGRAGARCACGATNTHHGRFCVGCGAALQLQQSPPPTSSFPTWNVERETSARLTTITVDGSEGASYVLGGDHIDLGREEGQIVLRKDPYLCPRHARFRQRDGAWHIQDLGSLNGVFIRVRGSAPLADGDLLLLGLQVLKFGLVNGADQALGPASQHGTLVFGSPAFPRYARLSQRTVEGVTRNVFYLHKDETTLGRESGDIVFSDDPFLSRRHMAIRRDPVRGAFTVDDFDSSNGTYLAIRGETRLEDGAHLRLGQHLFRFDSNGKAHGEGARLRA